MRNLLYLLSRIPHLSRIASRKIEEACLRGDVPTLISYYLEHPNRRVSREANEALSRVTRCRPELILPHIERFFESLKDGDVRKRIRAADFLSGLARDSPDLLVPHVGRLIEALSDESKGVKWEIAFALKYLVTKRPDSLAPFSDEIFRLLNEEPEVRYELAEVLTYLAFFSGTKPSVEELLDLQGEALGGVLSALGEILWIRPELVVPYVGRLVKILKTTEDFYAMRWASSVLEDLGERRPGYVEPYAEELVELIIGRGLHKVVIEGVLPIVPTVPILERIPAASIPALALKALFSEEGEEEIYEFIEVLFMRKVTPHFLGRVCERRGRELVEFGLEEKGRVYLEAAEEYYRRARWKTSEGEGGSARGA